jgi:uncharacterized protein with GYD domain
MATYVILSRFSPEAFRDPKDFRKLTNEVSSKIKSECPGVKWKDSFATLGRFDELARRVLEEGLTDRKAIKRMIKNWKPDFLRA